MIRREIESYLLLLSQQFSPVVVMRPDKTILVKHVFSLIHFLLDFENIFNIVYI